MIQRFTQGTLSVIKSVLWAPVQCLYIMMRIISYPMRTWGGASRKKVSANTNFHYRVLRGFWRLLSKYKLLWRFGLILITSVVLESLAPMVVFNLLSSWEQALLEKNMDLLWSLLKYLVVSEVVVAALHNVVFVMWRYLLGGLALQNRKESTDAILTDKGIDLYVGNRSDADSAPQVIMNECINFMVNFIPLYSSLIRTITFVILGATKLAAAGLGAEALGIMLVTTTLVKAAGFYSKTFNKANRQEFKDTSHSLNLLVGLRNEKNLHTFPNARTLVGSSIHKASDDILQSQTTRYRLTGAIGVVSEALRRLADPLLTVFVLARVYFAAGSTMTYAVFGGLIQIATGLSWNIVSWTGVGEWWSKMAVSLQNIEQLQENLVDKARKNPHKREHRDGLYAEGTIAKSMKGSARGLTLDFEVKQYPKAETFRTFAAEDRGAKHEVFAAEGDYILVVGHNGAGKTTMLNAVAKAIPNKKAASKQEDYVVLQVGQQTDIPAYVRNICQPLAEKQRSLWAFICYHWPHTIKGVDMTTLLNAETLPGKNGKPIDKRAIEKEVYDYLKDLAFKPEYKKLSSELHKYFHMNTGQGLSGGEVKKLFAATFLAIAKFAEVDVIILDEVTAGLDATSLNAFQEIMNTFHQQNREMIIFEVFHRTDNTTKGLNQKDKKIWSIGSDNGNSPAIKVFDDHAKFQDWAQRAPGVTVMDVSPRNNKGWLEYWFHQVPQGKIKCV